MKQISFFTILFCILFLCVSCKKNTKNLIVFYAPAFSPVIDSIRADAEEKLNIRLRTEVSGSQVICRKVVELGKQCDVMMLADEKLFKQMAFSKCNWQIDFAHDEIVIGIGIRAKRVDDAEKDWVSVLLDPEIRLARVDENLGPIGYRTIFVWKLKEAQGFSGLTQQLKDKSVKLIDDAEQLAVALKTGEIDYGFLYKTTCIKNDIRYISLPKEINLSSPDSDQAITYSLSIPNNAMQKQKAVEFIHYLLKDKVVDFEQQGYVFFKPKFYGDKKDYEDFKDIAEYEG